MAADAGLLQGNILGVTGSTTGVRDLGTIQANANKTIFGYLNILEVVGVFRITGSILKFNGCSQLIALVSDRPDQHRFSRV